MKKKEFYKYKPLIFKICKEEGIKKLMLFGSTLRDESTTESDIDLLVEFKVDKSLFKLIAIKHKFEDILHNSVDLLTFKSLSPYFRDDVIKESEVIYEI